MLAVFTTAFASPMAAQTASEVSAYTAITLTPAGGLAPMLTNTLIDRAQNGASLALRYGNLAGGDFNVRNDAGAVTAILPVGLGGTLSLTGGANFSDCDTCDPELMLGVGGDYRLIGSAMGNMASSPLWTISLDGELGYAKRFDGTFTSLYVGVPVALVQRGQGMQFVPFITPAVAFGKLSAEGVDIKPASAMMLGGGLGIYNTDSNVIINVGAQHSFMNGARNTIGINVLLGGR